jgi:hypothetical protein
MCFLTFCFTLARNCGESGGHVWCAHTRTDKNTDLTAPCPIRSFWAWAAGRRQVDTSVPFFTIDTHIYLSGIRSGRSAGHICACMASYSFTSSRIFSKLTELITKKLILPSSLHIYKKNVVFSHKYCNYRQSYFIFIDSCIATRKSNVTCVQSNIQVVPSLNGYLFSNPNSNNRFNS